MLLLFPVVDSDRPVSVVADARLPFKSSVSEGIMSGSAMISSYHRLNVYDILK